MPTIDPIQYLITALGTLTGGLVSDMQSLILGIVVISFILMGLDYLLEIFNHTMQSSARQRFADKASRSFEAMNGYEKGSFEHERARAQYRRFLNKSLE
jgi:hypothetical protein